jgi:hypothetical protein
MNAFERMFRIGADTLGERSALDREKLDQRPSEASVGMHGGGALPRPTLVDPTPQRGDWHSNTHPPRNHRGRMVGDNRSLHGSMTAPGRWGGSKGSPGHPNGQPPLLSEKEIDNFFDKEHRQHGKGHDGQAHNGQAQSGRSQARRAGWNSACSVESELELSPRSSPVDGVSSSTSSQPTRPGLDLQRSSPASLGSRADRIPSVSFLSNSKPDPIFRSTPMHTHAQARAQAQERAQERGMQHSRSFSSNLGGRLTSGNGSNLNLTGLLSDVSSASRAF